MTTIPLPEARSLRHDALRNRRAGCSLVAPHPCSRIAAARSAFRSVIATVGTVAHFPSAAGVQFFVLVPFPGFDSPDASARSTWRSSTRPIYGHGGSAPGYAADLALMPGPISISTGHRAGYCLHQLSVSVDSGVAAVGQGGTMSQRATATHGTYPTTC